jgi:hypothetical protein
LVWIPRISDTSFGVSIWVSFTISLHYQSFPLVLFFVDCISLASSLGLPVLPACGRPECLIQSQGQLPVWPDLLFFSAGKPVSCRWGQGEDQAFVRHWLSNLKTLFKKRIVCV